MTDLEWNEKVYDTLASEGWALLIEKMKEDIECMKEQLCNHELTEKKTSVLRSEIQSRKFWLNYKDLVEQTIDDLNEEN